MKLYVNTSGYTMCTVQIESDSHNETVEIRDKFSAQKVLVVIEEVLRKHNLDIDKATSVQVDTGPGSFTGIRVGVAIAQSLASLLNVPLNGKLPHDPLQLTYDNDGFKKEA